MNTPDYEQSIFEKDDALHAASPETETGALGQKTQKRLLSRREFLGLAAAFGAGLGGGYFVRDLTAIVPTKGAAATETVEQVRSGATIEAVEEEAVEGTIGAKSESVAAVDQLNLPAEYTLAVPFGELGPQLLAAGAINYDGFVQTYEQAGQPLTQEQLAILSTSYDQPVVINGENTYFLLNFFWAFGLTNKNSLLEDGPMTQYREGNIEGFASTGGWTLATKPIKEFYASTPIISLTSEQQTRVEEVAAGVYRPCCNNSTAFPDCNHGMAMLGLLELMAAQDATVEEMFEAAKYINAFWFPQQSLELALAFKHGKGLDFADVKSHEFVGPDFSSANGFQAVHKWLAENKLLEQPSGGGNSCGVS